MTAPTLSRSTPSLATIEQQVIEIVAEALVAPIDNVKPYSSLMDDLGAESIDFIDIVFRLESVFDTIIPSEELWAGSQQIDGNDPASIARGVAQLRTAMPEFDWSRFPDPITKRDLPRLITINSIATYLQRHLAAKAASA
jgi:acyl carrier protein